ncbi:hypothetical protein A5759_21615 [Mycobacterium sp. 852014-52144_SCH5372336]|nr:hypothetical protein A5759_21615 [Mycobacterium sp. 852014-52144_SCH5372336]
MTPPDQQPSAIVQLPTKAEDSAAAGLESLAGQAPLLRVIDTMLELAVERIVVVTGEAIADAVRGVLTEHDAALQLVAVPEPATPMRFLAAGLEKVVREHPAGRWVLVHDLRQPLASVQVVDRVLARLRQGDPVVLPAQPVTDSVKAVDERGIVIATLDRSTLHAVQYPRGFAVSRLAQLLRSTVEPEVEDLDATVLARGPITLVDGDSEAFVGELPRDAPFLETLIATHRLS